MGKHANIFFPLCVPKIGHKHQDCCVSLQNQHERNNKNNNDDDEQKNDTKTQWNYYEAKINIIKQNTEFHHIIYDVRINTQ